MDDKKIVLFIVEGKSDETALAPALEKIITSNTVKFKVMRTDITSDKDSNISNIERRIKTLGVKRFLEMNSQFSANDIYAIIHIVDLDGAFAPDSVVSEDTSLVNAQYFDDSIICKDKELFIESKNNKRNNLLHLSSLKEISIPYGIKVPYSIFYMSCNLDHVLHNKRNSTQAEKIENSISFSDTYDDPHKFEAFFSSADIKIDGSYDETWRYIQEGYRSLIKGSNFWICLNNYKCTDISIEDDC